MTEPNFRLLFQVGSGSVLVLAPDLTIVDAGDDYLRATMTTREQIVGRHVFEVFPDDPSEPDAMSVAAARTSFERVLATKSPEVHPAHRHPIRRPGSDDFEERFWQVTNTPIVGDSGQVDYILHKVSDVTEITRLESERLAQETSLRTLSSISERYAQLLDTAPDATVIVGEDGRMQFVNQQAERLFGYRREELVGAPLDVLIPERFRRGHVGHISRFFANPTARPMGSALELFGRRKDASELPIEVSLSPQRTADGLTVSAAIRDISERKRLEAAARVNSDRLASAVESIQDAFALFDASDRLILCNSVYRRLFEDSLPGVLVGRSFAELIDAWSKEMTFASEHAREAFRQERISKRRFEQVSTFDVRLQDGRRLRVADRQTSEGGIVKTIWDLTDEENRAEELRHARAAAEAASAAKSEFLSSMSHELRTPLNAILGFAQLLMRDKRDPLSQRHRERVGHILHGGEHLLRLIDDVLDLARIEAGRVSITAEPVSVPEVLEEVQRTLEPMATRHKVTVIVQGTAGAWPSVFVDRTRFAQILMNLGSNAIKYNRPEGQVVFALSLVDSRFVRVTVSDTGIGIPADKQEKLFQPFQRAGQETGPIEGTGIGLVITKRLAEMMGGGVAFRSVEGEGSTFWIDVPASAVAEATTRARSPTPSIEQLSSGAGRLVLYVEDNPANVTFMRDLLTSLDDIDVVTLPTAELGIEFARSRRPAVIIMDINLPGMSGVDALRVLRSLRETADIPIIALTAAASERDKQRGIEAGFYRYLTKPVKVDELLHALQTVLASAPC